MSSILVQIANYLPTVREPEKEQSLKEMLIWTGVALLVYLFLASINVYGGEQESVQQALQQLATFQTLLGAEIGSLVTLGIGPIVTSSIVLQMMVGSEILNWDTNSEEGKAKFQSTQKLIAYALCIVIASGYVLSGTFGAVTSPQLGALLISQIAIGGMLIIVLDDLVKKWGFGSGVGLFIVAGVGKAIFISSISPLTQTGQFYWEVGGQPVGALFQFISTFEITSLVPIISMIGVFLIVVYMQTMKVEVPLTFGNVRGFGQKWPLKFLYTSVMPIILVSALVANLQIIGTTLAGQDGCSILGCFSQGQAQSGLVSWLQAPVQVITNIFAGGFEAVTALDIFHIVFYLSVYTGGCVIFSIFWMRTSGQDADSVAEQISNTGMKVPGFRKDTRIIKKVLQRYIPGLAVLSGFSVGLIAAIANMTRAVGGGTGILLTVMILYRMYEQLAQKHMEELHPAVKEFFQ